MENSDHENFNLTYIFRNLTLWYMFYVFIKKSKVSDTPLYLFHN